MSYFFMSKPSIKISPSVASYNLSIKFTVVLLPQPDSPTKATFLPGSKFKFNPSKITLLLGSEGYMNFIFFISILPTIWSLGGFSTD